MNVIIFDGKKDAINKARLLTGRVEELKKRGVVPKLVWVSVGELEQNELYGRVKGKAAERLGIEFEKLAFGSDTNIEEVVNSINKANQDDKVHGIMVQLPIVVKNSEVRSQNSERVGKILSAIDPRNDVDCLTPENLGRVMMGEPLFLPATVKAVIEVLKEALLYQISPELPKSSGQANIKNQKYGASGGFVKGKRIVVVGGGLEVGKPLVVHLSNLGATVLWATETEKELKQITIQGDIVISATGQTGLINGGMVKDGVIAIDVGSPKGDFDYESVKDKAAFITPVPGGVGPVTVACLMENVVMATERHAA